MGYRSDVAYVIKFDDIETRDNFVTLMLAKNDKWITQALDECEYRYADDPIITFEAEDVKWYDSFDEVKAHNDIMEWAVELYEGAGWRIIQLGEDGQEEVNQEGECDDLYDYLYTSHSLNTEFPALKSTTTTKE